ncbi:SDR family NAD(P)-dependent oxidoreductase [Micavibrio aeruginosavorus]|uniref:Short chain dehydrogenase family protein n=1 Tax=Micavibrio aeruginosavorus (strain ARL-13) TaxID=856793 RepID=G2KRZ8_MICAA|nr:SDR family NAD(P)-dependent oxidoreductase [Micavibrio aeruginosavorus]AEP10506.1 short chain dehydrogenase family protein [Micavibrio aeruginosavorus ARL-13]
MKNYTGKTVWIIGASSGIGHALAQELHNRGATLILSARDDAALSRLNGILDGRHKVIAFDVTDQDKFSEAFKAVGTIDSVIYLAATYTPGKIADIKAADVEKTMSINLEGALTLLRHVIPHYRAQGFGQIALCGSVAGYRGLPGGQPYSATKAAIISIAESLRAEVADDNIDVRLISPGFVRTPMTDKNDFAMPMIIDPPAAARAIADGLVGRRFEIHFPKKFTFLMKLLRILPYPFYFRLMRGIKR